MPPSDDCGTYTLLLTCDTDTTIGVGALGDITFLAGDYAYTGSALGTGGFSRLDRHHDTATGVNQTTHWHIDYLLAADAVTLTDDITAPGYDIECAVAQRIADANATQTVPAFGASDCDCPCHLHYMPGADATSIVWDAYMDAMNKS